jgi:hypothetical protein
MAFSLADVRAVRKRPAFQMHFLSHGDAAPVVETHNRLDDVEQDNVARFP